MTKTEFRTTRDNFINGMKKQGVLSGTLTMRDFRNHIILKGER